MTLGERLLAGVSVLFNPTGCWEWVKCKKSTGYGQIRVNGKTRLAHRVAYEHFIGAVPVGLCVMHSCDNPPCINPQHLELGTQKENLQDMGAKGRRNSGAAQKARTHCPKRHPYSGENLVMSKGRRRCRKCQNTWSLANYYKRKAA